MPEPSPLLPERIAERLASVDESAQRALDCSIADVYDAMRSQRVGCHPSGTLAAH